MSGREWKPGDVALVEAGCWANRKVALRLDEGWSHVNGVNVDGDGIVSPVRPLVVIDPEDREQVERLREIASRLADDVPYADTVDSYTDAFAAALREFASPTPPKPEEPQGLGAVVEDARGKHFVRLTVNGAEDCWKRNDSRGQRFPYDQIEAVRVLSEGVTA